MDFHCPFARAILATRAACALSARVMVAERVEVTCTSDLACTNCRTLLGLLRERSRFALKVTAKGGAMPFGKEMRLMLGGLEGLRRQLDPDAVTGPIQDIHALVAAARERYGTLADLPFSEIVREVAAAGPRRRPDRPSR